MTKTTETSGLILRGNARELVGTYFMHVLERKFTDAERSLEDLKGKNIGDPEYSKGYVTALEGILLSVRSGDERDFINKANLSVEKMKQYKEDFSEFTSSPVRTSFDLGYFSAWNDLIQYRINKFS